MDIKKAYAIVVDGKIEIDGNGQLNIFYTKTRAKAEIVRAFTPLEIADSGMTVEERTILK